MASNITVKLKPFNFALFALFMLLALFKIHVPSSKYEQTHDDIIKFVCTIANHKT